MAVLGLAAPSRGGEAPAAWRSTPFLDDAGHRVAASAPGPMRVLMFWRADCGPCLIELQHLSALQKAAAPGELVVVTLGDARVAQAALSKLAVQPARTWRTSAGDAEVLTAFGGPPPRLPLSVAIGLGGQLCARRTGLLGTDVIRQWVAQCWS